MNKVWYPIVILGMCAAVTAQSPVVALSLDSAIAIGLNNNPELAAARHRVKASEGRFWSAVSPPPPALSSTSDYIPSGRSVGSFGERTIGVDQSVEFPTTWFLRGSLANRESDIVRREYEQVKLGVVSAVKKAYFKVLALQEQEKISLENLEVADRFLKKAEIRSAVGEGTNLEKLTANVQYTEAINTRDVVRNRVVAASAELALALGDGGNSRGPEYRLTDTLGLAVVSPGADEIRRIAASVNPQVNIARLRLAASAAGKKIAWSGLLPGLEAGVFSKLVRGDAENYYGVSFGISVPLWFMFDARGKIIEASAGEASAEAELRAAENAMYASVNTAFLDCQNAEKQAVFYRDELLPQAEEIFRTALRSYEAGEITYIEFLQARQTAISARSLHVDALLAFNLSVVTLEDAVGKNLQ